MEDCDAKRGVVRAVHRGSADKGGGKKPFVLVKLKTLRVSQSLKGETDVAKQQSRQISGPVQELALEGCDWWYLLI